MGMASGMWDGLANSNVEVSCHLVDIQMSMNPASTKGGRTVLTLRLHTRSSFNCSLEEYVLESMLHFQTLLDVQECHVPQSLLRRELKGDRFIF